MAAVTLLAIANGAGDVITALVASGTSGGISYNIGALYGAGLFCMSIVIASTIKNSKEPIQMEKIAIYRDLGLYIVATLITLLFGYLQVLNVLTSCIFLALYVILVLIVFIHERLEKKEPDAKELLPKS